MDRKSKPEREVLRRDDDAREKLPANLTDFEIPSILPPLRNVRAAWHSSNDLNRLNAEANSIRRDFATLSESAEALLSGSKNAEGQFRNVIATGFERFKEHGRRGVFNYGLATAVLQHSNAFSVDKWCRERIAGRMRALQAAFTVDFASKFRGAPLTQAANATISHGRVVLRGADARVPNRGATGNLSPADVPASPDGFGDPSVPELPPDSQGPGDGAGPDLGGMEDLFDPESDTQPPSFCDQLDDLLGQTYVDWAVGSDSDPWARLIGNVEPPCVAFNTVENTLFRATPASGASFPATQPADVRLVFAGAEIAPLSWTPGEITFRLPPGSVSGVLFLRGPFVARSGLSSVVLEKLLSVASEITGATAQIGVGGGSIGVIYPPRIKLYRVNGFDVTDDVIELEACREAAQIVWQIGMEETPGLGIPSCADVAVVLLDEDGNALISSTVTAGRYIIPAGAVGETSAELVATISFSGQIIGVVRRQARFHRASLLRLEMRVPTRPQLIGSQQGTVKASISCAAPYHGVRISLQSSMPAVLSVPEYVTVLEGDSSINFMLHSLLDQYGRVTVTARASGYENVELELEILEPNTAVVLSGGGAKGSFQAGAISYLLHHEWETLRVKTIVGTSVGSINALGLAHDGGIETAFRIERQWLALRVNRDMFEPAEWIIRVQSETGVDIMSMLSGSGGGGGSIPSIGIGHYIGTAAVSLIPVVNTIVALLVLSTIDDYLDAARMVSDFMKGRIRNEQGHLIAASSLFDLDPARARLTASVDMQQIVDAGLNLRLCMVSLTDGKVYYMDERGHLLSSERDAAGNEVITDEPVSAFAYAPTYELQRGSPTDVLVAGSMASSAIPLWLATVRLCTGNWTVPSERNIRSMVDGGVREVLPTQIAIDLGARLLVSIAAGNPAVPVVDFAPTANFSDIGLRGLEMQGAEVAREDRLAPNLTCRDDLEMILVEPSPGPFSFDRNGFPVHEIHGAFEINPTLVRINLAYGYMRAFDEFLRRNSSADYAEAYASSEEIIRKRRGIYDWEDGLLASLLGAGPGSGRPYSAWPAAREPSVQQGGMPLTRDELAAGRVLKHELFQLVHHRFTRFGPASLPKGFGAVGADRRERIFDWWEFWEHIDERLNPSSAEGFSWYPMALPGKPFDRQTIWNSATQRTELEISQPQAPVVPQSFLLAMS
ncbi:MAG: patatin-like phospholipase family protein [Sphingomonadaceae bacterium]|nr:patatin-like phospholipase family protein [Sphingomonadaceae bacterium]